MSSWGTAGSVAFALLSLLSPPVLAQQEPQPTRLESRKLEPLTIYGQRMQSDLHLERLGAVRALLDEGLWEEARPLLLQGMKDEDSVVRMVTAFALGNIRTDVASARQALMGCLRDQDAHVRRFSALALGSMGKNAAGSERDLKALATDPDSDVQKSAAWAARRVESGAEPMAPPKIVRGAASPLSGGAAAPRQPATRGGAPGAASAGTAPASKPSAVTPRKAAAKPQEAPPEGRIYFLNGLQEVDERGQTETRRKQHTHTWTNLNLFGDVRLEYLDVKEAWLYRQDAKKRGLNADLPLAELLRADPQARGRATPAEPGAEVQRYDFSRLFGRYSNDHVVAISCNGQTRFEYRRFDAEGKRHDWGGFVHLGMTTGRYGVEVRILTADGFRLDFKYDVDVEVNPQRTVTQIAALNATKGPQEIAPDLRRRVATPNPARKNDGKYRAQAARDLALALVKAAEERMDHAGWTAFDVLPYLQDAVAVLKRARRLDPTLTLGELFVGTLGARSLWCNTPEGYATSLELHRMIEASLAGVPYDSPDDGDRWAWGIATGGRNLMAQFAIWYRNDIPLFWLHQEERLKHVNSLWRPSTTGGTKVAALDLAKERDTWPQPGWWRSEWDTELPPELPEEAEPEPEAAEEPAEGGDESETINVVEDLIAKLKESLDEVDERRAKEVGWLNEMCNLLRDGERKKIDVKATLRVLAQEAAECRDLIAKFRGTLATIPAEETRDINSLEDFMKWAIENWPHEELSKAKTSKDVRAVLDKAILDLGQKHEQLLRKQDELIQETLDYYERIVRESESIGDKSRWKEVREETARIKREVSNVLVLSKAELYLVSEQEGPFRAAAREALELGRYEAKVRWMEAAHFLSKKDMRHALHLYRQIVELTKPDAAANAGGSQDTSEYGWMHERSRQVVHSLEGKYLRLIDAKAFGEAADVRAKLDERLKKGGEDSWWQTAIAYLKVGAYSAASASVGREDALEGLSSKFQEDVAAQHCGLLIIRSLHERGVALKDIEGLSNERFQALIREKYNGRALSDREAIHMRAAIKAAFDNPDMDRLAYNSKQMLDVDTGKAQFDTEEYEGTLLEWLGDSYNLWNVLTMVGPNTVFKIGGKIPASFRYWGKFGALRPTGTAVTLKEAFVKGVGLQKLGEGIVRSLAGSPLGKAQMDNLARFLAKASWGEARGLDMAISRLAGYTGEAIGGTMGVVKGGDGRAEAEAGKMLAELITSWGVGDVDVMKNIMKNYGVQTEHIAGLVDAAQQAARSSEAASRHLSTHVKVLQQAAAEAPSPDGVSAASRAGVRASMEQIQRRLDAIAEEFQAGRATPELCQEVEGLRATYEADAALESGMLRQSGAWQEAMDSSAGRARARAEAAAEQAAELRGVSRRLEADAAAVHAGTMKPGLGDAPAAGGDPLFGPTRGAPFTRDIDRLFDEGRLETAMEGYERRLALVKHFNPDDVNLVRQLETRVARVRVAREALFRLGTRPEQVGGMDYLRELPPRDLERLAARSDLVFRPVSAELGKETFSKPYWVIEVQGGVETKIGLFKPSAEGFANEYDLKGEVFYQKVAKAVGVEVPACGIVELEPVAGKGKLNGVFIRMAPGESLLSHGLPAAIAVKKKLAQELMLSLVLGDHDRKLDNFFVRPNGDLISLDHAMTDPAGRRWSGLESGLDTTDEDILDMWKEAIFRRERWTRQGLTKVDELMSAETMQEFVDRQLKPVVGDPEKLKSLVESVYSGSDAKNAMQVIPRRLRLLQRFVKENFRGAESAERPAQPGVSGRVVRFPDPATRIPEPIELLRDLAPAA